MIHGLLQANLSAFWSAATVFLKVDTYKTTSQNCTFPNHAQRSIEWISMMVAAMWFGGRTVVVAIVVLAMAGQLVQGQVPSSRQTGYSASVDLKQPVGSAGRGVAVLESNMFQVWLEGDDRNKCSLSVREKYTGRGPPSERPLDHGYLLWSANYYSHTPAGADKCTLKFTAQGELQLWIRYRDQTSLTWSSKTSGQGVTRMALQIAPADDGNFVLLTASNKAVFQSFNIKEWLVLSGQKFWSSDVLRSPDQVKVSDTRVIANSGKYIMAIRGGDLQLLINGPKPQLYWSLKSDFGFKGDLSKVRYAEIVKDDVEGIGLFTASGTLVYRIVVPPWVRIYGADKHFGLNFFGNLQYFHMYKGMTWGSAWSAIPDSCNLPLLCGQYGLCTYSIDQFGNPIQSCACPQGFKRARSVASGGCVRNTSVNKCNHTKYLELSGYESAYLRYVTPTTVRSLNECKAGCSTDCKCDGVFYKSKSKSCYKVTQILTLKKATSGAGISAFIKVK